ncbi:hypothetical protein H4Q26_005761 [Puccinia striiformis f. sp. tritici PST-130]|nr:hypothetical protein H4Q26_005761 [Puccinia striiformis f. sp. tritici PST-130]
MRREANGPSVDGRHHPTPAAPPLALVNNLETAIAEKAHVHSVLSDHIASNPSPTPDHEPTSVIPSAPPLGDLVNPLPRKNTQTPAHSKRGRFSHPYLLPTVLDPPSRKHSFFVDFQAEQRKILAIKAIERGLSTWQNFMKTEPARERFRGRGKGGVAQNHPMGEIGQIYRAATEQALDDSEQEGHQAVQNVTHSSPAVDSREMRGTVSMAGASVKVQDFVDEWVIKCLSVLNTSPPGKQRRRDLQHPSRSPFVQLADDLDGQNTYGTRFHGWLVGQSSEAIAAQAEPENSIRPRTTNVKARLARLIGKKTENIWTKWPWTDCEKVLAKHGFELVLHPKIRTERHIFNRPGKHLLAPDIQALHLDLDNKYIDVVRVPRRNSSRSPSITPSERSRSSSSSPKRLRAPAQDRRAKFHQGMRRKSPRGLASRKQSRETLPSRPVVHLVPKNPPLQVGPLLRPL